MTTTDLLIVASTLVAPLLAVQVQKWLERYREENERRVRLFKTLMATRAMGVSPEHVQALNMIDLEFQGEKFKQVRNAWKLLLDHLGSPPQPDDPLQVRWGERRADLLAGLLSEMGKSLGYDFDEVHLKKAIYAPVAQTQIDNEQRLLRKLLIELLEGKHSLNVSTTPQPDSKPKAI